MATPLPFPGLSAVLASYGKLFKSRQSFPRTDGGDRPTITAMIPALNEERTIPYALTSLAAQTVTPNRIIVVDDGSTDDTAAIASELDDVLDVSIEVRQHDESRGKTVGVKEVARTVDTDTVFVLDADTFLESETYLERLRHPHSEANVASSFGIAYPTEETSKQEFHDQFSDDLLPEESVTRDHIEADLEAADSRTGPLEYLTSNAPVVQYRNVSYHVEQRFFGDGFYRLFDSALFPVGCGVLYDREKLVSVFDDYEESHGNDLTNSEDIFIGFAFCDRGWANVQVDDAYMRSEVPGLKGTFKQNYLWGSGFLQSAYYFGDLTTRYRRSQAKTDARSGGSTTGKPDSDSHTPAGGQSLEPVTIESDDEPDGSSTRSEESGTTRQVAVDQKSTDSESSTPETTQTTEQEFDTTESTTTKEPLGRAITARIVDGLYPTTVFVFLALSLFGIVGLEIVGFLVLWELSLYTALVVATRSERVHFARNFVPFVVIRTLMMPVLTYTYARVATDIVTGNRNWRK